MSREDWLQARKVGLGGSDAAAIAGLNKWKSPIGVYLDKTGQAPDEDIAGEAAYWGTVMEDIVAQEFSKRTGLKVRKRNAMLKHPEYPFMLANVDRLIVGTKEGLECKTASEYLKDQWEGEDIPASYLLQCQHYMAVTGYKVWWIAVLIGGNKFVYKKVERDEELIQYLIDIEKNFWEEHVLKQIPPAFDGSEASGDLLKALYPVAIPDTEISLPPDTSTMLDALEQINKDLKQLETQKKEYENKIKALMEENEKAVVGDRLITWKSITSNRFDSKRFSEEYPDLHKRFTKQSSYRKFAVKQGGNK
ncbi:YqaJ viral recombinase family protein [Bacillus sp. V3B]|uniref:YqaJ viral recombinase family nuclease n=1 Tax=Bacillus sp. V3B TaxID=2804915 RepID=UPI00210DDF52|nr:YqaJ viral recombinase family protein [Bacillus sp. V3B]MCQ6275782.1 YqaJ viral recombinase family protein [Bacillus sp. V3B]